MKRLLLVGFIILHLSARATVGPDLSRGTDVEYFTTLRFETAQKEGYSSIWKVDPARMKIHELYRAGEVDQVLVLADDWLKRLPIDADVHLMVAMCYKEKGDLQNMSQHLNAFYGLLRSITSGGDGRSERTAFKVVSVDEEYTLLQEIGAKLKNQKLIGNVDRLEVERRGGKSLTLYFDVSVHLRALNKAFDGK